MKPTHYSRRTSEHGFTLIELLIVVTLLAILAGIAIPTYLNTRNSAAIADAKVSVTSLLSAAEQQRTAQGTYRADIAEPERFIQDAKFDYGIQRNSTNTKVCVWVQPQDNPEGRWHAMNGAPEPQRGECPNPIP